MGYNTNKLYDFHDTYINLHAITGISETYSRKDCGTCGGYAFDIATGGGTITYTENFWRDNNCEEVNRVLRLIDERRDELLELAGYESLT